MESTRTSEPLRPSTLVSVLMPCYRDVEMVKQSLPRVLQSAGCDLEVVLLNNDARQAKHIRELVDDLGDPRVRLLELEHEAGFTRAINQGIDATTGEVVFFANSDLLVAVDYLDSIVRFFDGHPGAACASGKILRWQREDTGDVIDTAGHVIGRNRRVVDRGENEKDVGQFEQEGEVFGVSGAALVARRTALESIKVQGEYLDESFSMYKDDVDLCWRFRLFGWDCWYVPSATARHGRTSHGLAGTAYRSGLREYHENEREKPRHVRMNSMKNQWLTLVKNDDLANVARDLPHILGREALVLGYNLVFAPRDTAIAMRRFLGALPSALDKRREIKARQTTSPSEIRRWFAPRREAPP